VSQPYIGEIRIFAGNYAPYGWMFCQGQLLPINEYDTLFNLIGTTYGGDGQSTFQLPDLRGRLPIHQGGGFTLAQKSGVEAVTLTTQQIPAHSHPFQASTADGNANMPSGNMAAKATTVTLYYQAVPTNAMGPNSISSTGGSLPHDNFQPYLCLDFIISLFGIYPSQT
jgi:microcystin-dependent protein